MLGAFMKYRSLRCRVLPLVAIVLVASMLAAASRSPIHVDTPAVSQEAIASIRQSADRVDQLLLHRWTENGIEPAAIADDSTVLRRIWMSLAGTVPSLEEIRRFESDREPDRLDRWLDALLHDRRSSEYLAKRLARSFIGNEGGQFIVFRRDRFTSWLSEQLHLRTPYDRVVREMVATQGLWTGEPAVNFVTQAAVDGRIDENKLAGRVSRAMLGQRIDCAQCHNHPFASYTQSQFEGLAACFAQARLSPVGVEDDPRRVLTLDIPTTSVATSIEADRDSPAMMSSLHRAVAPGVPFGREWMPTEGTSRENLAGWITHPVNRRFERAVANRAWGIAFGRPWHEPVDDLPNPLESPSESDLLDLLGADFRARHCDYSRLLAVICSTRAFRLASTHPGLESADSVDRIENAWAVFPLTRLLPDQMIGAMVQAGVLETIDRHSHLFTRTVRFFREIDFVREYGDAEEGQGGNQPATIPQALVRMNGKLSRELIGANAFTSSGRISSMSHDDHSRIETVFLVCLTRRPTAAEEEAILPLFTESLGKNRSLAVEDLFWTLTNSPEFCWNH